MHLSAVGKRKGSSKNINTQLPEDKKETRQELNDDSKVEIREVPALLKKKDPKTGKRKNPGTFNTRAAAQKHERAVQYFKRHQVMFVSL